jgi:small subunit ribosomal protein S6
MTNYELILIFDPNLGEEKTGVMVGKIEEKLKSLGGEVEKVDKWGVRRLASMIKKAKTMTQGYYVLVKFKAPTSVPAELRSYLKVNESIVRYFLSLAVVVLPGTSSRRTAPGAVAAPSAPEAVEIGEIKGKPLGESQ